VRDDRDAPRDNSGGSTKVNDTTKPAAARPAAGPRPDDPAPYYRLHIFCCQNQRPSGHPRGCCLEKGAEKLRNYMKARAKELGFSDVRVNQSGCLDRCELGPTMVIYPDGVWYRATTNEEIDEILERHVGKGERVERLMLKPEDGPPQKK
jgi:(2Fe-2S) ferredoxin